MVAQWIRAMLALVVVVSSAACGGSGTGSDDVATTGGGSTTPASATSTTTTTAPTTTTATTTAAPSTTGFGITEDVPPLLVAHGTGIDIVEGDEVIPVVAGRAVEVAYPDHQGGVVYQEAVVGSWQFDWDPTFGHPVPVVLEGTGPQPIMWVRTPGAEPQVLVDAEHTRPWLSQVAVLDGNPTVVFRDTVYVIDDPDECRPGEFECLWGVLTDHLFLHDLQTGEIRDLGAISSFESSSIGVVFGDQWIAVRTQTYGETDVCGAVYLRSWIDPPAHDAIGEGGSLWRRCEFGPGVGTDEQCSGGLVLTIAPDESTLAIAEYCTMLEAPELAILALSDLTDQRRMVIGDSGVVPTWISFDGSFVVVGRLDEMAIGTEEERMIAPLVIAPDGTTSELPISWRVAFWADVVQ